LNILFKSYRYLRILSVDVALGACVIAIFIANYLEVSIPLPSLFTLGICVWLIYTADHLMDAYSIKHRAHSLRHLYHQKYFKRIVILFILGSTLGLISLFFLPPKTFHWGAILFFGVFIHFIILKLIGFRPSLHKEFIVAIIYVAGIFLVPLSIYQGSINNHLLMLFFQFMILALVNLLLFAMIEETVDKKDRHTSFVQFAGRKTTLYIIWALLLLSAVYPIYIFATTSDTNEIIYQIIIIAMNITLAVITYKRVYFMRRERYRIYGDAIFLYPLLVLFL
jgi:hypothetical protein